MLWRCQKNALQVDIVVVYKIDRFFRSLTDFAELAMFFEEHNVQFVAVTQEINTATSSGRMRLNILMTFTHMSKRSFQNVPVISSQ